MDVPVDFQPPPAYGEPLSTDQFDAKTHQGLQVSAQTPQPSQTHDGELWETWDDALYAANATSLNPTSSASGSSSSRQAGASGSSAPQLSSSASVTTLASASHFSPSPSPSPSANVRASHFSQRRLPQIPQVSSQQQQQLLSRSASTSKSRDRKPLGARSSQTYAGQQYSTSQQQKQQMEEALARKEAERYLTSAPVWNPASITTAAVSPPGGSTSPSRHATTTTTYITAPIEILPSPISPTAIPPPMHSVVSEFAQAPAILPTVVEAPEVDETRHAALFGDNTAWRRNSDSDDEAPPPFAPVAPALGDASLEEAMAQLQRLQFATPEPALRAGHIQEVGLPASSSSDPSRVDAPHLQHASSAPATSTQASFRHEQASLSLSQSPAPITATLPSHHHYQQQTSIASPRPHPPQAQHHRYSAPPAPTGNDFGMNTVNVAPSPPPPTTSSSSSPRPVSVPTPIPHQQSPSSSSNMTSSSSASSGRPRLSQPPMIRMRFDSSMAYEQNSRLGSSGGYGGDNAAAANPAEFYAYVLTFLSFFIYSEFRIR